MNELIISGNIVDPIKRKIYPGTIEIVNGIIINIYAL